MDFPHGGLSTPLGKTAFSITIVSLVLVSITLVLRIWAKIIRRRRFMSYDYFYFVGYVFAVGYSAAFLYGVYPLVMGMHMADAMRLYPDRVEETLKVLSSSTFVWAVATTSVKLSLLSLYLKIFTTKLFKVLAWTVAACSVMLTIASILVAAFFCRPFAYYWDLSVERANHCGDDTKLQLSTAVVNMILDFLIVLLPLPILWQLQMSWKRKALLSGIFSLGLCICAMNLARTIVVVNQTPTDTTRTIALIGTLSTLEINVGMICAALPTLGPLFFRASRGNAAHQAQLGGYEAGKGMMNSFVRRRVAGIGFVRRGGSSLGFGTQTGIGTGTGTGGTTLVTLDEGERDDGLPLCEAATRLLLALVIHW
ncbi:hypothetical protein BJY00DRAFT_303147 [Aspergillus carlsbadensis]|nr:hypothetical protein BJY00DRAFT_303147 [Aspergillus carlsbadensis]